MFKRILFGIINSIKQNSYGVTCTYFEVVSVND